MSVTLSSSVPLPERATLKGEAATASVNVLINVTPLSTLRVEPEAKKTCEEPFTTGQAFCEEAITAGAGISVEGQGGCTAGPMLIRGDETYMLTAGHCFGGVTPAAGENFTIKVSSKYVGGGALKEIGKEGKRYENTERDYGEIKVNRPGLFSEALPNPVPALTAEWVKSAKTPHAVEGVQKAEVPVMKQVVCHEGLVSGEQCGEVIALNVTAASGKKYLVETNACSEGGDSGGPYFFRVPPAETRVLMEGIHYAKPAGTGGCPKTAASRSYFEPLLDVAGAAGFGILATFNGRHLLTTANEARKPRLRGAKGESLVKKSYTSKSGSVTLEAVGGSKVTCSADSGDGEATGSSTGTSTITFTGCEGFSQKCYTAGAALGEVVIDGNYTLAFVNGAEDEVGLLLELAEATIECGTVCPKMTSEKLKLRGTAIALTTPVDEEVTPSSKFKVAFSQSKGVQSPTEYENEEGSKVKAIVELEGSGSKTFGFEHAGISDTDELLFEETAEIES